jgi:hypothetical protein
VSAATMPSGNELRFSPLPVQPSAPQHISPNAGPHAASPPPPAASPDASFTVAAAAPQADILSAEPPISEVPCVEMLGAESFYDQPLCTPSPPTRPMSPCRHAPQSSHRLLALLYFENKTQQRDIAAVRTCVPPLPPPPS